MTLFVFDPGVDTMLSWSPGPTSTSHELSRFISRRLPWAVVLVALLALASALPLTAVSSPGSPVSGGSKLTAAVGPQITPTPTQGPTGSPFTVVGDSFTPDNLANVTLSDFGLLVPTGGTDCAFSGPNITVDPSGVFSCNFTVPTLPAGPYTLVGEDNASATSSNVADFAVTALVIAVDPTQGPVGSQVAATGTGFTVNGMANVTFNGSALVPYGGVDCAFTSANITLDSTGGFDCSFHVPSEPPGFYNFSSEDNTTSNDSNLAPFEVTVPSITATPGQGPSGASVNVSGSGFSPTAGIALTISSGASVSLCSATVASNGTFNCTVTITSSTPASYTLNATGSDGIFDSATTLYRVTSQSLTLTPDQGPSGVTVTADGTGFTPSVTISTTISSGATISGCGVKVTGTGTFSCAVTIVSSTPASYTVNATGSDGPFDQTSTSFDLTKPVITLTPSLGPSGAKPSVSGSGFTPGATVAMSIEPGASISGCSSAPVSSTGAFGCTVTITSSTPQGYTVTATGSDESSDEAIATYTVTTPVLALSPTQGPSGVLVTASGTGFTPAKTVTFSITAGGTIGSPSSCPTSGSGSFSECTFTVSGGAGDYAVTAKGSDGSFDSNSSAFTITTPFLSLSPTLGPSGASSTASGTGFTPGSTVTTTISGSATVSSCDAPVMSSGTFNCVVTISGSPNSYTVTASGSDGSFDSATASYRVTLQTLTLTPDQGPNGVTVTADGTGFTPNQEVTTTISGVASITDCDATVTGTGTFTCSVTISSPTPDTFTVTATGSDGSFDQTQATFTITATEITLAPTQGPSGVSTTIAGSGFTPLVTLSTSISSGASISPCDAPVSATGTFSCAVTITSATAAVYTVTVEGSDETFDSASATFDVTSTGISLSPTQGPSGVSTLVSGTGFTPGVAVHVTVSAGASVTACGASAVSSGAFSCAVTITSSTPGLYTLTATGSDGAFDNATASFRITLPSISLNPVQGPSGVGVSLSGSGFTPLVTIQVSISAGASVTTCGAGVASSGTFSCSVIITSTSHAEFTVTASGSDGPYDTASTTFTITVPMIALSPFHGPSGVEVSLTGTGYTPGVTVTSSVSAVASITSCGATVSSSGGFSCTVSITSTTAGDYAVTATGSDGSFDDASTGFTITAPALTLSPAQGPSGASTNLIGSGFTPGVSVTATIATGATVGACAAVVGSSGGFSCAVTISSTAAGAYTITATGSDGSFDQAAAQFTITILAISLAPGQGPTGSVFEVVGSGFAVGSNANVTFDGVVITPSACSIGTFSGATVTTDVSGVFSCAFVVPAHATGSYPIVAVDITTATESPSIGFTITGLTLTVSPGQGPVGSAVTISGSGFSVSSSLYSLSFDAVSITSCASGPLLTGSTGAFSCAITVPQGTSGTTVNATDPGGRWALATFAVTVPQIAVSVVQATAGSPITITGSGFTVGSTATVAFSGSLLVPVGCSPGSSSGTTITTDSSGAFACTFNVPAVSSGGYSIVATNGATSATTTPVSFTVSASSPSPSSSSSFPWWIVGVVAIAILAILAIALYLDSRRRRAHRRSSPTPAAIPAAHPHPPHPSGGLAPWQETEPPVAASTPSAEPAVPAVVGVPAGATIEVPASPSQIPPADIDELIARLDRISVEVFKRTPKELQNPPGSDEGKEASAASDSAPADDSPADP